MAVPVNWRTYFDLFEQYQGQGPAQEVLLKFVGDRGWGTFTEADWVNYREDQYEIGIHDIRGTTIKSGSSLWLVAEITATGAYRLVRWHGHTQTRFVEGSLDWEGQVHRRNGWRGKLRGWVKPGQETIRQEGAIWSMGRVLLEVEGAFCLVKIVQNVKTKDIFRENEWVEW